MQLYNTLTRRKEPFLQIKEPIGMYVCGVTPQDEPHLGHALATVIFEVLQNYMRYRGMKVKRVQNFTDVDDKIIARAADLGIPADELAQTHIDTFYEAMDGLNVRRADVHPRVSEEIPGIVELIEEVIAEGAAYEANGSVYYRVSEAHDYGKLSGRSLSDAVEDARAAGRLEPDSLKERQEDFALWKAQKPGEPAWSSPWGPGRPGWHIECSAMARRYLGDQVDIHGGGLDLIFPHHENEVAQSETATGMRPFARYWIHNGLLRMSGDEKMSKSLGNVVTVRKALEQHSADAIRLWIFQSHYRSPATYDPENLAAAGRAVRRLRNAAGVKPNGDSTNSVDATEFEARFTRAMEDDLGTPSALAAMFDLASAIQSGASAGDDPTAAQEILRTLCGVLGFTLDPEPDASADGSAEDLEQIERLVQERGAARARRDYADADRIRDELAAMGIELEDGRDGTTWRRA